MEFSEVVRRRRMIRHYSSRPLDPEIIERVIANALRAPSAGFAQGWAFLALTDAADRARFWPFVPDRVAGTPTMQEAPLVVVALASKDAYLDHYAQPGAPWPDRSEAHWAAPYWFVDTGMAALAKLPDRGTPPGRRGGRAPRAVGPAPLALAPAWLAGSGPNRPKGA